MALGDALSSLKGSINTGAGASAGSSFGGWIVILGAIIGLLVVSAIGAFLYFHFSDKRKWNIKVRVHYENPNINGIAIGDSILAKRVRFKNGIVAYLYKYPIQGYTITPELLTWTRPREHDIIVTQDKKLFSLVGFTNIDVQRKKLGVDVSYPDIEMDRQDLQQHVDSKKFDDPNEKFKIIAKITLWVFVIVGIIVVSVIGGKAYVDGKNADAARDNTNLQVAQYQAETMRQINTFILILSKVMPESFEAIDGQNLLNQTLNNN